MSYKLRVGRGSRKSRERTCESRGVCRDVCAACASLAAFAETFAQLAQVLRRLPRRLRSPRWVLRRLPRRLRSLRKSCGVCRGVCAARASLAAFAGAFAQPAQVLRRLPGHLRSLRKSCGVCRDVCAACAGSCGINRKKRGNKPAKSCSLSLLPNRRMSTLYPLPSIRTSRSACRPFR